MKKLLCYALKVISNHFKIRSTMTLAYQARLRRRFIAWPTLNALTMTILLILCGGVGTANALEELSTLPDWVKQGSFEDGETNFLIVETEEFFLRSEASMVLMGKIRDAVDSQIDRIVGAGGCRYVDLNDNFIQRVVVAEEMVIEKTSAAPESQKVIRRHIGYAKLRFDDKFSTIVNQQYQLNFKAARLKWTGVAGILTLCWLAAAYGYLRLDNATRHFYSRRLQTLAFISCLIPLIIAILVAIGWKLF